MGEIWFIRHGQASFRTENYDRLSPLGHQQSDWLGAHLAGLGAKFDQVISGTLRRHRETAAGVLRHLGQEVSFEDPRLNEMAYTRLETSYCAQFDDPLPGDDADLPKHFTRVMAAWQADKIDGPPERYAAFQNRVLGAVKDVARAGKKVMIISSGGPKGILMGQVLGLGEAAISDVILATHNSALSRFHMIEGGLKLAQYNAIPHLEDHSRAHARTYI